LAVLEGPLLGGGTCAGLDDDGGTVGVGRRGQALSIVEERLDKDGRKLRGSLGVGEENCDGSGEEEGGKVEHFEG